MFFIKKEIKPIATTTVRDTICDVDVKVDAMVENDLVFLSFEDCHAFETGFAIKINEDDIDKIRDVLYEASAELARKRSNQPPTAL